MTVNITKPALNLRAELKSPPRVRRWLEQQFWFENLIANGTFDAGVTGWTASAATLSATAGRLRVAYSSNTAGWAYISAPTQIGHNYRLSAELVSLTGSKAQLWAGSAHSNASDLLADPLTVGTNVRTFAPKQATTFLSLVSNMASGQYADFDNVSLYPADAAGAVIHALPYGWKPLHVHEDGRLKREGALEDYTVSFDGFRYAVKPAIAPGAATETCIIAIREGADQ